MQEHHVPLGGTSSAGIYPRAGTRSLLKQADAMISLQQHGSLLLLCIVFRPLGEKRYTSNEICAWDALFTLWTKRASHVQNITPTDLYPAERSADAADATGSVPSW